MPLFRRKSSDEPEEAAAGEDPPADDDQVDPAAPPAAGDEEEDAIAGLPPSDASGAVGGDFGEPDDEPLGSHSGEDLPPAEGPGEPVAPEEPAAEVIPEDIPPELIDSTAERPSVRPSELDESEPLAADEEPLHIDEEPLGVAEGPVAGDEERLVVDEPETPGEDALVGGREPFEPAGLELGEPPPPVEPAPETESAVGSAAAAAGAASAAGVPPPPTAVPVRTNAPQRLDTDGLPGEPAVSSAPVAGGLLEQRPEVAVLAAFAGGLLLAGILKRLGRG